ncbi:MAG: 50S ribosomal protein L3 [Gemmatimonadetes bacterium]|nr:50S ribosomal protein L3 [Gemmatimonadota bacterium]
MAGLIGRKLGMTQIFDERGALVPVTVVEAGPCPVLQVKTADSDGYAAIQLGFGARKERRVRRAERGHAGKAGLAHTPRALREFRVDAPESFQVGQQLTVDQFHVGERVKVTGASKGRGFQGVVKRHGFRGRPGSHGHPKARNPGTLGPGTNPSRVIKGKKLPGQMGNTRHTERNLRVERIDAERHLLFVRGAVPGARNNLLLIRKA